jgi:hypothetical protein
LESGLFQLALRFISVRTVFGFVFVQNCFPSNSLVTLRFLMTCAVHASFETIISIIGTLGVFYFFFFVSAVIYKSVVAFSIKLAYPK